MAKPIPPPETYDAASGTPVVKPGLRLSALQHPDGRVFHRVEFLDDAGKPLAGVPPTEEEIAYAMGSGTQGRSYLVEKEGGFLYQSPLSWYKTSKKKGWDLSPGYEYRFMHFGRTITGRCIFCHCNQAEPLPEVENKFRTPIFKGYVIGCERCHGPGQLHVALRKGEGEAPAPGEVDYTIVNPSRLEPSLREDVCQQCHLQGEEWVLRRGKAVYDYRPGLPLHESIALYVKPPDDTKENKAVTQVEQMNLSRCYHESGHQMGCSTCHDPHSMPSEKEHVAFYRGTPKGRGCLSCHADVAGAKAEGPAGWKPTARACTQTKEARLKRNKDSCYECHMPSRGLVDVVHAAGTDHRILRTPDGPGWKDPNAPAVSRAPLIPFHEERARNDPDRDRDLALAIMKIVGKMADGHPEDAARIAAIALQKLDTAARDDPTDVPVLEARAYGLWKLNRLRDALVAYSAALKQAPERETSLRGAVRVALKVPKLDDALTYGKRLVRVNPWSAENYTHLALAHFARNESAEGMAAVRQALKLNPTHAEARGLLVIYHLRQGEEEAARRELELTLTLNPRERDSLRAWFESMRRARGSRGGP
jgi:hypothetical protein